MASITEVCCCRCSWRDSTNMRTRKRYIFFLTTAVLLLFILCGESLYSKLETRFRDNNGRASLGIRAADSDSLYSKLETRFRDNNGHASLGIRAADSGSVYPRYETRFHDKNGRASLSIPVADSGKIQGPVPVLLMSYMRSGSSFTGDVIASYPSSFYIFEPLKLTMPKFEKNSTLELINGTTLSISGSSAVLAADFLYSWLTCNFDILDKDAVVGISKTTSTKAFRICLRIGKNDKNEKDLKNCLKILQKQCESSKIRLVKTIRVRMRTTVEILLERIPGLKVINLFRDQRPRLLSAEKTPFMMWHSLKETANRECTDALDDIEMRKVVRQEFPGQVETLLYEQLAEEPIGTAKRLFDFLNLPLTKTSVKSIQKMTTSSTEFQCNFCTTKQNSAVTAHAWRSKNSSNFEKIKLIEKECENIQRVLGYVPIKDVKELRNMSIDLRIETPFTANVL